MTFFVNDEDRFGGKGRESRRSGSTISWKYILVLLALVISIVALWFFLPLGSRQASNRELPFIRADEAPFKVKSNEEGVPGIQHQDKLVYGRIRENETPPAAEHILPDSEPIQMIEQYAPEDINPEVVPVSIEELIGDVPEPKKE